jgi:hypothetical protein
MRARIPWFVGYLAFVSAVGCGQSPPPPQQSTPELPASWQVVDAATLTEAQATQRDQALAARDALMARLKGRMQEVVSSDGYAAAISVCKEDAPRLAREISTEHNLAIGRTSHRLRNPTNQPPEWAEPLVVEKASKATFLISEGRLAALLPIPTGEMCLSCHGAKEEILNDVLVALNEKYPDDMATGFEAGDVRGWFWVEVGEP